MVYILHPAVLSLPYSFQAPSGRRGSPLLQVPPESLEFDAFMLQNASGKEGCMAVTVKSRQGKVDPEVAADNGGRVLYVAVRDFKFYRDVQEPQVLFPALFVDNLCCPEPEDIGIKELLHAFGCVQDFLSSRQGTDRNATLCEAVVFAPDQVHAGGLEHYLCPGMTAFFQCIVAGDNRLQYGLRHLGAQSEHIAQCSVELPVQRIIIGFTGVEDERRNIVAGISVDLHGLLQSCRLFLVRIYSDFCCYHQLHNQCLSASIIARSWAEYGTCRESDAGCDCTQYVRQFLPSLLPAALEAGVSLARCDELHYQNDF